MNSGLAIGLVWTIGGASTSFSEPEQRSNDECLHACRPVREGALMHGCATSTTVWLRARSGEKSLDLPSWEVQVLDKDTECWALVLSPGWFGLPVMPTLVVLDSVPGVLVAGTLREERWRVFLSFSTRQTLPVWHRMFACARQSIAA